MRSRGKKNSFGTGFLWGVVVAVLYYAYPSISAFVQPNLQKLVQESELNNRQFSAKVSEVVGSRTKVSGYLMSDDTNPIVSVSFRFKNAGIASENEHEQGIANLTALLLSEGAGDYSAEAMKEELETRGIRISFEAGKDDFIGRLLTTKENLPQAVKLLNMMLTSPRFDKADVERAKKQMIEALKRQKENPAKELSLAFAQEVFGTHPYARNPLGQEKDILSLEKKQLQSFVADNLISKNLLIGIAGDVSEIDAAQIIDEMFGGLPENGRVNFVKSADIDFDGRTKKISRDVGQNVARKAVRGVLRTDKDFYPLFVANHILGGAGLTSKLSQRIREEKGLTYGIYSYLSTEDKAPLIIVDFSTTPDKFAQANKIFTEEWQKFYKNGVNAEELARAKEYLLASHNLRFEAITDISTMLVAMQKYNLGLDFLQKRNDYIKQIQLDDVNSVIKKYFLPQFISAEIGIF